MYFWIPALMPLLGAFVLLVSPLWPIGKDTSRSQFERIENLKKFGIYLGVNLFLCVLIAVGSWAGAVSKTKFPEVWNFKVTDIRHEHEWTTREQRSRQVPDGTETYTDSSGNTHTRTKYRTEYYYVTEHHGPYWNAKVDGSWNRISSGTYNKWAKVWGNERQTGMHHGSSAGLSRSIDGPIMECKWPRTFETIYPWSEIHSYVNKIRVSQSVLKFGEPTEEMLKKYPRPADKGNTSPVVSYGGPRFSSSENLLLRRVNADLGSRYEIHTILVTLPKDAPMSVFDDIMSAWGGPNKNELVTFVALDGKEVKWVRVHSWMDNTTLHARMRDSIAGEPFSVEKYAKLLRKFVPKHWIRKEFTPVNEYLRVPVNPAWMIWGILIAIVSGVIAFIVIEAVTSRNKRSNRFSRFRIHRL